MTAKKKTQPDPAEEMPETAPPVAGQPADDVPLADRAEQRVAERIRREQLLAGSTTPNEEQ